LLRGFGRAGPRRAASLRARFRERLGPKRARKCRDPGRRPVSPACDVSRPTRFSSSRGLGRFRRCCGGPALKLLAQDAPPGSVIRSGTDRPSRRRLPHRGSVRWDHRPAGVSPQVAGACSEAASRRRLPASPSTAPSVLAAASVATGARTRASSLPGHEWSRPRDSPASPGRGSPAAPAASRSRAGIHTRHCKTRCAC